VRVEIMGLGKYENVGESQSVLIITNPMISTHTRSGNIRCRRPALSSRTLEGLRLANHSSYSTPLKGQTFRGLSA
jgi:hypothetical protein